MPTFFDRALEVLILIGVWVGVYFEWKALQHKQQQRIKGTVTRLLKHMGVKVR